MWPNRDFGLIYRSENDTDQDSDQFQRTVSGWKFRGSKWLDQKPNPDEDCWHDDDDSR
jgi:hypothetical protein